MRRLERSVNASSLSRRRALQTALGWGAVGALGLRDDAIAMVRAAAARVGDRPAEQLASDEDFWFQVQQAYTVDRSMINLNNGGVSPSPRVVQDAMRRHLEFANNAPARNLWQIQDPQVENVRARLARTFGCGTEELAITRNASESLQICIYGIDLQPGDEVLATELDYPRMITTYRQRELRDGIRLRLIPIRCPVASHAEVVDAYRRALTDATRVMLVSHIVFVSGQVFPVRDIVRLGRERGIPVIVDGAHAFAHLAYGRDDLECDYYGVSLHKWLTAPHGSGFLYVRRSQIDSLWPMMAAPIERKTDIRKFEEIGTHPAANYLAIAEALTLYDAIGPRRKEARLRYLRDRWARRLMQDKRVRLFTRLEPEHCGGFATLAIDGVDGARLAEHLWLRHKIFTVYVDYPEGRSVVKGIRVSPNTYTTVAEIDMFCDAVEDVLANGLPA